MKHDAKELAKLVEKLLNERAQKRKRELLKKRMESDDFINDVHEAEIGIDPNEFDILSETTTEEGEVILEWNAIEYVLTEFTVDEPYQFHKTGKVLLKKNGNAELLT
ncbi:MAG: hypothetical protein P1Q69_01880 [Candidatus Thorarchaeota archaeon]|nr:hypothetical protein [Candidatus Thorarchaeota archaeon]